MPENSELDYSSLMAQHAKAVESYLNECVSKARECVYAPLLSAMQYSLEAGGKRIRPVLLLEANRTAGGNGEAALMLAGALEMIHTYSLIHDDLPSFDDDDFRRGKPSNHKVYGEAMAVLAGDGLLNMAYELLLDAAVKYGPSAANAARHIALRAGAAGMVGGQAMDISAEKHGAAIDIRQMHSLKTGALLSAAIEAGILCAQGSQELYSSMSRYAQAYGVLFQITDDLLDFTSTKEELGKSVGKDQRDEKLTYVTLHGLDGARRIAQEYYEQCRNSLKGVASGEFFLWLAETTLHRRH